MTFPANFIGFQGHFPGRPVLPGVCLVLAALLQAEGASRTPLVLREVVSAKFYAPVEPEVTVRMTYSLVDGRLKTAISGPGGRVAEIKLTVDGG